MLSIYANRIALFVREGGSRHGTKNNWNVPILRGRKCSQANLNLIPVHETCQMMFE